MHDPDQATTPAMRSSWLIATGVACLILAAKWYVIDRYGVNVPFNDQWNAEIPLYRAWNDGNLTLSQLLAPHNEHRIFTTRAWALMLYGLNGLWNTRLQMLANSFLHVAALLVLMLSLWWTLPVAGRWLLAVVTLAAGAYPWGYINTLGGFQAQFYFSLLFQSIALWLLVEQKPLTWRWWLGWLPLLLATLSLGSGFLAAGAAAVVLAIRAMLARSPDQRAQQRSAGFGAFFLLVFFFVAFTAVPDLPSSDSLHAHDLQALAASLLKALAWPFVEWPWPALVLQLPLAVLFFVWLLALKRNEPDIPGAALTIALGGWGVGNALAFAYARGGPGDGPVSHHGDTMALLVLANAAALVILTRLPPNNARRERSTIAAPVLRILLLLWITTWCIAFLQATWNGRLLGPGFRLHQMGDNPVALTRYLNQLDEKLGGRYYSRSSTLSYVSDPRMAEMLPTDCRPGLRPDPLLQQGDTKVRYNARGQLAFLLSPDPKGVNFASVEAHFALPPGIHYVRLDYQLIGPSDRVSLTIIDGKGSVVLPAQGATSVRSKYLRIVGDEFTVTAEATGSATEPTGVAFQTPCPVGRLTPWSEAVLGLWAVPAIVGFFAFAWPIVLVILPDKSDEPPR